MNPNEKVACWQEKININEIVTLINLMKEIEHCGFCEKLESIEKEGIKYFVDFSNIANVERKNLKIRSLSFASVMITLNPDEVNVSFDFDDYYLILTSKIKDKCFDNEFIINSLVDNIIFDYYEEEDIKIKWINNNSFMLKTKFGISNFIISEKGILNIDGSLEWLLTKDLERILSLTKLKDEEGFENDQDTINLMEDYSMNKLPFYKKIILCYLKTISSISKNTFGKKDWQQTINLLKQYLNKCEVLNVKIKK